MRKYPQPYKMPENIKLKEIMETEIKRIANVIDEWLIKQAEIRKRLIMQQQNKRYRN